MVIPIGITLIPSRHAPIQQLLSGLQTEAVEWRANQGMCLERSARVREFRAGQLPSNKSKSRKAYFVIRYTTEVFLSKLSALGILGIVLTLKQ